ncbi:MAG TPA: ComEC/Rec2 family competence protein [Chloroflexota bacterium]|nr:ComEC/Rec2 family competence protein [Chloroflexota bacterium]
MTLLALCVAALVGLLAGQLTRPHEPGSLVAAATLGGAATLLARKQPAWRLLALCCCAAALGALRAHHHRPTDADPLANFSGLDIDLRGEVSSVPIRTDRALRFVLTTTAADGIPVHTRVLVIAEPETAADNAEAFHVDRGSEAAPSQAAPPGQLSEKRLPALGDSLQLRGRLRPNDGTPPRAVLFPSITIVNAEASAAPLAIGARLRTAAMSNIQAGLPEPQASLAAGVLLGGSGRLSPEFRLQLQRSGLAHIVAIDGYKQVLVSGALAAAAVRLVGRPIAAAPILLGVVGYTLLTGARPSAVRAGLMVVSATLAGVLGRLADPLTSCVLAAAIMATWDPEVLFDVGFQLSFTATLGLILLWPRLRRFGRGLPHFVVEPGGITLAVTIATLPVMLVVFQSVSLISPLAHVIAMPLLPLVLLGAALLAVTPLVSALPLLAQIAGWLAWLPTTALVEVVRISGSLPGAAVSTGHLPMTVGVALGLGLLAWGLWELPEFAQLRDDTRWFLRRNEHFVAGSAVAATGLIGLSILLLVRADGRLHAYPLSVAPGEAVLLRGPTGRTALVASGRVDRYALVGEVAERLALWEHGLAAVVPLDADAEARLGPMLERYPAEQLLAPMTDQRLDLAAGAVLDSYADGAASASFGHTTLTLVGQPPLLAHATAINVDRDLDVNAGDQR